MALQTLYSAGAFGGGAKIWIIPYLADSHWSQVIDWYLNFQVSNSHRHRAREISSQLKVLAEEVNWQWQPAANLAALPLMVASQNHLPAQCVVEMPEETNKAKWLKLAFSTWQGLGSQSLRLFLPKFISVNEFLAQWPGGTEEHEISLVSLVSLDPSKED